MRKFNIQFEVGEPLLGTIVALLAKDVQKISIQEMTSDTERTVRRDKLRTSDTRSGKAILDFLCAHPGSNPVVSLCDVMEGHGFARTSAGSTLARMVKEGTVLRTGEGMYAAVK